MHQVPTVEFPVGIEEPVGGYQVDPRVVSPPGQQGLQHTGCGGFADRHAARDPDDERHRPIRVLLRLTEELRGGREQPLARGDLEVDQPGERQVHLFDLEEVEFLAHTAQSQQLVLGEFQRRRHAQ